MISIVDPRELQYVLRPTVFLPPGRGDTPAWVAAALAPDALPVSAEKPVTEHSD
jgi:hypothetical protein